MIKALVFDFFDVIHKDHQKAWLVANGYQRNGVFAEASDLLDRGEISFDNYLERYAAASDKTAEVVRQEFKDFAVIDEAVVALIGRLRQQYATALVSNAHTNELRPILENYDLEKLFDQICISSELGIAKPDPRIFQHIADRLELSTQECLFIDDNSDNIAGAERSGMAGVVFTSCDDLMRQLRQSNIVVD